MQNGSSVSGFLMKVKGFALGDRLALKTLWPAVGGGTLYHHYTGEVHIIATDQLYPNAARNDLESNPARQLFLKQAEDFFYPLSRKARLMQAQTRAVRLLDGIDAVIARLNEQKNALNADAYNVYRDSENYSEGNLRMWKQEIARHIRKPRGRPRVRLDDAQQTSVTAVTRSLRASISQLGGLARDAQRRTQKPTRQPIQPPPQVSLLNDALTAVLETAEKTGDSRFEGAATALRPLVNTRSVSRAIVILDEMKAAGVDLGTPVESSRRELRALIGWSRVAPVSLEEALAQEGIALEGQREERLVRAIDRGLVVGLGGRGERFETALRAIAESDCRTKMGKLNPDNGSKTQSGAHSVLFE